jgi:hypothetical protein
MSKCVKEGQGNQTGLEIPRYRASNSSSTDRKPNHLGFQHIKKPHEAQHNEWPQREK